MAIFENVSGPSPAEVADAARRLIAVARQNGGRRRVVCGSTEADEKEWNLMNLAAQRLEQQGRGEITDSGTESFTFTLAGP